MSTRICSQSKARSIPWAQTNTVNWALACLRHRFDTRTSRLFSRTTFSRKCSAVLIIRLPWISTIPFLFGARMTAELLAQWPNLDLYRANCCACATVGSKRYSIFHAGQITQLFSLLSERCSSAVAMTLVS